MTVIFIDIANDEEETEHECDAVPRKGEIVFLGRMPLAHKYVVESVVWEMRHVMPRALVYLSLGE